MTEFNYCVDCEYCKYLHQIFYGNSEHFCQHPGIMSGRNPVTKELLYPHGLPCREVRVNVNELLCKVYEAKRMEGE